jgi:hypothetical protein
MNASGNMKIIERDLTELARDGVAADQFRLALRLQLMEQATSEAEARGGYPVVAAVRPVTGPARSRIWTPTQLFGLVPRWGAMLTAALLLIVLAGTSYATEPIINQLFGRSPDTNQLLGTAFNLTQTANGYTMTLQRAYADRQVIIIGYTITGEDGRPANGVQPVADARVLDDPAVSAFPVLTDDQGQEIPVLGGSGYSAPQANAMVNTYSGASIPPNTRRITLHLQAGAMEVPQANHEMAVARGRWAFTFTIPVAPSRIAQPHQTVVDHTGWAVTLDRVAITQTQVGVVLRGAGTDAQVELIAGNHHYTLPAPGGFDGDSATGLAMKECLVQGRQCPDLWKNVSATYGASADLLDGHIGEAIGWAKELQDEPDEWTLVVTAAPQPGALYQPRGGPWVFHFTMR